MQPARRFYSNARTRGFTPSERRFTARERGVATSERGFSLSARGSSPTVSGIVAITRGSPARPRGSLSTARERVCSPLEGAPDGVRGLQFYPSRERSTATCLWEAPTVKAVQTYVDSTLGDSSENTCFEVDAEHAFSRQPLGIAETASIGV